MAGRVPGTQNGIRTCVRCRQKFQRPPGNGADKMCSACRATIQKRIRKERSVDFDDRPAQPPKPADYPGAEWGPLPPALLIKIGAHVLAREYVGWAAKKKGRRHVDNPA